jgi:DNA-binding transcriptional LysR family regulator
LRSVDLNLLVMFDALMAERHVTRAARHNGISQPAMSKALNRLRHLLDDPLFERRDGRMEPTPRALDLAGPIRSALSDISRTLTAPEAPNPSQFTGAVRIAAIDLHQTTLLPALTTQLRLQAPRLDLRIQVADRDRLYDQLANGEVDVAIAPILIGMPELCAEMLWRDRLVTLIGAKNRLKQPLTLEAYAAADHVVDAGHVRVAPDGRGASLVDSILAARGLRRRIAVVLPSSSAVPHVVAAGRASSGAAALLRPDGRLDAVPVLAPCRRCRSHTDCRPDRRGQERTAGADGAAVPPLCRSADLRLRLRRQHQGRGRRQGWRLARSRWRAR